MARSLRSWSSAWTSATTKICSIVGELTEEGIDIIGIAPTLQGLRKGVVVNIEPGRSYPQEIEEAELMAGCEISTVYTGIAGGHIKASTRRMVGGQDKEVATRTSSVSSTAAKASPSGSTRL